MTANLYELLEELERLDQPYTDSDNSAWFAQLEGDRIRYVHPWNKWIVFVGNHWKVDGGNALIVHAAKSVSRRHIQRWAEQSETMTTGEANQLAKWAKQI